jgi:hypothetical protein
MADRKVKIVKKSGKKPNIQWFTRAASVALDKNSLVEFTSGYVAASDDDDTMVVGILRKEVATTDDDYASETKVPVEVIMPGDVVEIDADKTATVGEDYGISNAYTIDVDDTTNIVMTVTEVLSSTRVRGFFKSLAGRGVAD